MKIRPSFPYTIFCDKRCIRDKLWKKIDNVKKSLAFLNNNVFLDNVFQYIICKRADRPAVAAPLWQELGEDSGVVQSLVHDTKSYQN